jgi:hypothetical protein
MTKLRWIIALALGALVLATGVQAAPSQTYKNPFRYCAAVGTIDIPDARYTGPQIPVAIARGLAKAFGLPPKASVDPFLRNSYWRCMDGKVYACNVGANIPCMSKANISLTATTAMNEYCQANPDAEFIPAYVAGRETVYLWKCIGKTPGVVRQVNRPDARGFLANFWYQIEPKAS